MMWSLISMKKEKLVKDGCRISDPTRQVQIFQDRLNFNGLRCQYRVLVDTYDYNRVITIFPFISGSQ